MPAEPTPQQAAALEKIADRSKLWRAGTKKTTHLSKRHIPLALCRQLAGHGWLFHPRYGTLAEWHIISDKEFYGMGLQLSADGRRALNAWRERNADL